MGTVPRVSEDHLAARRQQIVAAALRCFARDGFHATSVRDVVRESGLSAGAVYSYFPSKDDLVAAAVEPILGQLSAALDDALAAAEPPSPLEAVGLLLARIVPVATGGEVDYTRVAVTAWGEALRDPAVGALARGTYRQVRERLAGVVVRWRDAGHLPPGTDVDALVQVVFSIVTGYVLQHALLGDVDPRRYAAATALLQLPAG
jgi:AcrR family transcriptional regulator